MQPVTLHIIGDGESRDAFIDSMRAAGVQVEFHGKIFDPAKRQAIFDRCDFGINMMKDSVCVGLTMKSLDYFAGGLPILNVNRENLKETAGRVVQLTPEENFEMRKNTLEVFDALFSEQVFKEKLENTLDGLLN